MTARPEGYKSAQLKQAHVLEVLAFTNNQVKHFINKWHLSNKILASRKDDPGVRLHAQREADDLLSRLRQQSALKDLTNF